MITVGQRLQMKAEKGFCFDVELATQPTKQLRSKHKTDPQLLDLTCSWLQFACVINVRMGVMYACV